jgi:hypothetical protein
MSLFDSGSGLLRLENLEGFLGLRGLLVRVVPRTDELVLLVGVVVVGGRLLLPGVNVIKRFFDEIS